MGGFAAPCGDGCLDRLVVSVRRAKGTSVPLHAGSLQLGEEGLILPPALSVAQGESTPSSASNAASQAEPRPLLLLGLLSGSRKRRDLLRCTWLRLGAGRAEGLRVKFVVGRGREIEDGPDMLLVNVTEGERMRAAGQVRCGPAPASSALSAASRSVRR